MLGPRAMLQCIVRRESKKLLGVLILIVRLSLVHWGALELRVLSSVHSTHKSTYSVQSDRPGQFNDSEVRGHAARRTAAGKYA